jgi:hypothetical protein
MSRGKILSTQPEMSGESIQMFSALTSTVTKVERMKESGTGGEKYSGEKHDTEGTNKLSVFVGWRVPTRRFFFSSVERSVVKSNRPN